MLSLWNESKTVFSTGISIGKSTSSLLHFVLPTVQLFTHYNNMIFPQISPTPSPSETMPHTFKSSSELGNTKSGYRNSGLGASSLPTSQECRCRCFKCSMCGRKFPTTRGFGIHISWCMSQSKRWRKRKAKAVKWGIIKDKCKCR